MMARYDIKNLLSENSYPGRGIIVGKSSDEKSALIAYFIMGRSANSRNRIFELFDGGMRTKAFDESKLEDPSLIIYNPYLSCGESTDIITNGDQTNTIFDYLKNGETVEEALLSRKFEPDAPNYTPRISGVLSYDFEKRDFRYQLSILKSMNGNPDSCVRCFYNYEPVSGIGHFIHTYKCDGNPIPSFEGEPEEIALPNTAEELSDIIWSNLDPENKVSLYVRQVPLDKSKPTVTVLNKNR